MNNPTTKSEKLSKALKGREITWSDKISKACKGRVPWNKGLTKETDPRLAGTSEKLTGRNITWGAKISENRKGKGGEIQSILKKQIPCQIAGWNKGLPAWSRGLTKETHPSLRRISEQKKALWRNPEWVAYFLSRVDLSPNKAELRLAEILERHFLGEWGFVGDGGLVVGGKIPDFANINGKKQLIELFGDYWHKGENPQKRINSFMHFGFATIVIWESELDNEDAIVQKVKEFPSVETLHGTYLKERMKTKSDTP